MINIISNWQNIFVNISFCKKTAITTEVLAIVKDSGNRDIRSLGV